MARRRKKRERRQRCFACGTMQVCVRHGVRKDGSTWHLCQQCRESYRDERDLERETVEFLQQKGAL